MATLIIRVEVGDPDDNENIDPSDATGLSNEAYERLHGVTHDPVLSWLGEIEDTELET